MIDGVLFPRLVFEKDYLHTTVNVLFKMQFD